MKSYFSQNKKIVVFAGLSLIILICGILITVFAANVYRDWLTAKNVAIDSLGYAAADE